MTFMDDYRAGRAEAADVHAYVERWKTDTRTPKPRLHIYLGMTFGDVERWRLNGALPLRDPGDRLLTTAQISSRYGRHYTWWWRLAKREVAPPPDDPDDHWFNPKRRVPRWKLSTVERFMSARNGR